MAIFVLQSVPTIRITNEHQHYIIDKEKAKNPSISKIKAKLAQFFPDLQQLKAQKKKNIFFFFFKKEQPKRMDGGYVWGWSG